MVTIFTNNSCACMCVCVCTSVSALHAQLGLCAALDLPVDPTDFLLRQRPLHVAVDDAIAVAPPPSPEKGGGDRK